MCSGRIEPYLWFAFQCATHTVVAATPQEALKRVVDLFPELESPIEEAFWRAYLQTTPPELDGLKAQQPEAEAKAKALLEGLGGAAHSPRAAA
ncbi:hypothetical protein [Streptomyces sp. NRRL S-1022]|uniref:hypothetical protein n=1 Tax=Streptomyces sp. NRRL S-1022 TaxID=1463880 RepID=UPI0004C0FA49|nr:hypothetical protein [Streptomyces sp. NRRL S-1022]